MHGAGPARARENQILEDEAIRRFVAAATNFQADGDVGIMVLLLAAIGARFSQLQRMTVGDVQADRERLFIPLSRTGRGKCAGHYPMRVGSDVIDALRPLWSGRRYDEPLLVRWRMEQLPKEGAWQVVRVRDYRSPWTSTSELTRHFREICALVGLTGMIPYTLRHSSIVRAIRAGLPMHLVAAIHDISVVEQDILLFDLAQHARRRIGLRRVARVGVEGGRGTGMEDGVVAQLMPLRRHRTPSRDRRQLQARQEEGPLEPGRVQHRHGMIELRVQRIVIGSALPPPWPRSAKFVPAAAGIAQASPSASASNGFILTSPNVAIRTTLMVRHRAGSRSAPNRSGDAGCAIIIQVARREPRREWRASDIPQYRAASNVANSAPTMML